jgi:Na+(H+)/acetate symporter ActP
MLQYSPAHIFLAVTGLVSMLLLLFGFIFTGIVAFSTAGAFSASINSIFPILAGKLSSDRATQEDPVRNCV